MQENTRHSKAGILQAAGLNLIFLIIFLSVCTPYYQTNDDYYIMNLVNGGYGFYEHRLVYINAVWGCVLKVLYLAFPSFPWYAAVQYFLIFCSFTLLCWAFMRHWKPLPALLTFGALLSIFGLDAYVMLQYTKTAAILTLTGLFLMFQALEEKDNRVKFLFTTAGIALSLIGMMYRTKQFWACGIIVCFIIFDFLYQCLPRQGLSCKVAFISAGKLLRPFFSLLILAVVLLCIDRAAYLKEDWAYYKEYNVARTKVMDYDKNADYNEAAEQYRALGISESMFSLLLKWDFLDTEIVNKESFEAIIATKSSDNSDLLNKFVEYIREQIHEWDFFGVFWVFVVWLLFGRHDKVAWMALICAGAAYLFLNFYMTFKGRYNIYWVDYGLFLALAVIILWFIPRRDGRHCIKSAVLAVTMAAVLIINLLPGWGRKFTSPSAEYREYQEFIETVKESEQLYIADTVLYSNSYCCESPFSTAREATSENLLIIGGWQAMYPPLMDRFACYGVENPYRDCVNNEAVYLLTGHIELTLDHIRESYYPEAEAIVISPPSESLPYGVYKIIG